MPEQFRAWNKNNNAWFKTDLGIFLIGTDGKLYFCQTLNGHYSKQPIDLGIQDVNKNGYDYEINRFTGAFDENEHPLYEQDLVKSDEVDGIGVIKFGRWTKEVEEYEVEQYGYYIEWWVEGWDYNPHSFNDTLPDREVVLFGNTYEKKDWIKKI